MTTHGRDRPNETPRRHWGLLILRLTVAAVFIAASADKIIHPDRFADVVWEYDLLPLGYINLFAVLLPWVELILAACLIAGIWVPAASMIAAGLSALFLGALLMNIARGNEYLHCGCFSTSEEGAGESLRGLAWRDLILLCLIAWLFIGSLRAARHDTGAPR